MPRVNLAHAAGAALRVFSASTAVQQSQPFGIETRDEYKLVHTSSYDRACMEGVARQHKSLIPIRLDINTRPGAGAD